MTAKILVLIGVGGFIGSVARYLTTYYVLRFFPATFPYGTFAVNILGCLAIGIIYGLSERFSGFSLEWRLFLATGICGGYTTFSTFSYENMELLQRGEYKVFALYVIGSFALSLGAVFAGLSLTKIQWG